MVSISFDNISKQFGDNTVISGFDAEISDNEFLVLLGPSGCGKSTMLRMIAGLTGISSGTLRFGDRVVNDLDPKQRKVAFVFQSYALYPHMSVRDNIAFPLVMDRYAWWFHIPFLGTIGRKKLAQQADVAEQVEQVAELLELSDYLDRRPKALSGGQRQRVAVARAIVRDPDIYLFDEPLSNLDAKLRTQMRAEISALHARVNRTFIYVTHDQVEAMTMGTQIAILNDGFVQQIGSPAQIYDSPVNVFVASFIGSPPMNIIPVELGDGDVSVEGEQIPGSERIAARMVNAGITRAQLGIRPEKVTLDGMSTTRLPSHVIAVEQLGAESIVGVRFGPAGSSIEVGAAASRRLYQARIPGNRTYEVGSDVSFTFDPDDTHLFDAETGKRVDSVQDYYVTS